MGWAVKRTPLPLKTPQAFAHDMKGLSEYNRLKQCFWIACCCFWWLQKSRKKCFCFKKNLKQKWGVVVSFNVRKHMSYKASLSRRKDSSEFSTNWWKLRTALGKQFTSHIISPGRVESPNFPSQFCHLSATRPLLVGQKCQVVIHL